MFDTEICSTYVSEVIAAGFADAAERAELLVGHEVVAGPYRLAIGARKADGFLGAIHLRATLDFDSVLARPMEVEVAVSPWSTNRSEVGLSAVSRLGSLRSRRTARFLRAAQAVIAELAVKVAEGRPVPAPVEALQSAA